MKSKLTKIAMGIGAIALVVTYQNCSGITAGSLTPSSSDMNKISGDEVAIAIDNQGDPIPVVVENSADVVKPPEDRAPASTPPAPPKEPKNDEPVANTKPPLVEDVKPPVASEEVKPPVIDQNANPPIITNEEPTLSDDLAKYCGFDVKTIHRLIDVSQYEGKEVGLSVIQGKTLIYSSNPDYVLKTLNIGSATGRTIICGLKVDNLSIKKGRLEVYQSEIKAIGEQKGTIVKDAASRLPAGY